MAKRTSGKTTVALLAVLAVAGLGGGWFLVTQRTEPGATTQKPEGSAEDVSSREMTDSERETYLGQHADLRDLKIEKDRRTDTNEVVPGLLRVSGTIHNRGERKVHRAFLHIYPKDSAGAVLGSHVENVVNKGGILKPGAERAFSFTIPEKKGFGGDFGHSLR